MTLADAIIKLQTLHLKEVVKIEFEDGSGNNFNYRLKGENKDRFFNFKAQVTTNNFVGQFMEAKKIMDKW